MAEDLKSLKKEIDQLKKEIKNLGGETFVDMNKAIEAMGGGVKGAQKLIKSMTKDVEDLKDTFGNISSTLKNIVQDLKGAPDPVKETTKSFDKLESIARKISEHKKGEEILTVKQLKNVQKQTDAEVKRLKELEKILDKNSAAYAEVNDALNEKNGLLKDINIQVEKELQTEKTIQKTLGVTGGLFKGITKSLEHIGIESEHFEKMNEDLREAAKNGNSFKVIGAGLKSVGKGIKESLSDPLIQIAVAAKAFHSMYEIGVHFSKESADIARTLGVSNETAGHMVHNMEAMAASSADNLANTKDNLTSFKELNDAFGTSVEFSQQQLLTQTKLKEVAGLTTEEASKLAEYEQLTGKSAEDLYNSIGKTNKSVLSQKKITQEVLKTSGQLAAQYKNNPDLLAKAVTQAQKLGMTLEQTKKITSGLLNFEDSISAELEAELLTGEDLNLERARGLALQGKTAEAAEELMKNLGPNGLAKFQNMNTIQQEAYAKALGMSADELADSLTKQAALAELEKKRGKGITEQVKKLEAAGETEKAAELQKRVAQGETVELAMQRLDAEANLAKSVDKTKDSLTSMVAGPLGWIVEKSNSLIEMLNKIPGMGAILGGLGALAAVGTLIAGVAILVKTVGSLFGKGPANETAKNTKRTADAVEKMANSGGSGTSKSVSSEAQERYTRRYGKKAGNKRFGKKGGKFGKILGGLGSAIGMASMFGSGEDDEEGDGLEPIIEAAESLGGEGGGGATKAAKSGRLFGKTKGLKSLFKGKNLLKGLKGLKGLAGGAGGLIASLGVDYAAEQAKKSGNKKLGKGLDVAGGALTGASTGAMIGSIIPGVGTLIGGAVGGLIGGGMSYFGGDEPELAVGGIVNRPTRAVIGEAGAEAVIPLDKFYAKLDELINVAKQGGNVYMDSTKVGTAFGMSSFKSS
jgi:hypothetical protein